MSNTDGSGETDSQSRVEDTNSDETTPHAAPQPTDRQQLIDLAVRFLNNPRVVNSPADQKRTFLKKKGLTDEEIDIAVRQSSSISLPPHTSPAPSSVPPPGRPQYDAVPHYYHPPPTSWRSYLFRGVVVGGVVWIAVRLVRQFLSRWRVQQELQMQQRWQEMHTSIQQLQSSINSTVTCINETTQTLKDLLTEQHQQIQLLTSQVSTLNERQLPHAGNSSLSEIQKELGTLKGLMLNRHQFPTPQKGSNSPSIPNWQRSATSSLTLDSSLPQQPNSPPKENGLPAPAFSTSAEEEEEEDEESDKEGKGLLNNQPLLTDKEANN